MSSRVSFKSVEPTRLSRASDRVFGSTLLPPNIQPMKHLRPIGLTLFHIVVLARTVREQHFLYTALENQCFWFSDLIMLVIETLPDCEVVDAHPVSKYGHDRVWTSSGASTSKKEGKMSAGESRTEGRKGWVDVKVTEELKDGMVGVTAKGAYEAEFVVVMKEINRASQFTSSRGTDRNDHARSMSIM